MENAPQANPTESYAFALNVGRLTCAASYTLAPGHELRRARPNEIARLRCLVLGTRASLTDSHSDSQLPRARWQAEIDWRFAELVPKTLLQIEQLGHIS